MKLGKLASGEFKEHLKNLLKQPGIPAKTQFALRGVVKAADAEVAKFDEAKAAIIADCVQRDEKGEVLKSGDMFRIKPEKAKTLDEGLKELHNMEINLQAIKYDDLGTEHKLDAEALCYLEFIVE